MLRWTLPLLLLVSGCCVPWPGSGNNAPSLPPLPPLPQPTGPHGTIPQQGALPALRSLACGNHRRIEGRAAAGEIPQIDDAWDLFGQLPDGPKDPVVGGVLVCDLRLPGTPWFKSRPDMQARVSIAKGPAMILVGHDNRDNVVMTAPIDRLTSGDRIEIAVEDRDLFTKNDPIDAAVDDYSGSFPMLMLGAGRELHVICQHLEASAVASKLPGLVQSTTDALNTYDTSAATLDRVAQDWGFPWSDRQEAERHFEQVVAHVGWTDNRVKPLRDRLKDIESAWQSAASADVASLVQGAPALGRPLTPPGSQVAVTVGSLGCHGAARSMVTAIGGNVDLAPSCVLELHLEPVAAAVQLPIFDLSVQPTLPGGGRPDAVFPDGRTAPLVVTNVALNGRVPAIPPVRLDPGQRLTLQVATGSLCYLDSDLDDAVLLRLGDTAPAFARMP